MSGRAILRPLSNRHFVGAFPSFEGLGQSERAICVESLTATFRLWVQMPYRPQSTSRVRDKLALGCGHHNLFLVRR
jgi:hypothetical protein